MDGMYSDLGQRLDRLQRQVKSEVFDLESKLGEVEQTLEELERLPREVRDLEYEVGEAKQETTRVESELDDRICDVHGSVERVGRRVAALERHIRQADGAHVVDLDHDNGGELHGLAVAMQRGLEAQGGLLTDYERSGLKLARSRLERVREERDRQREAALEAASVLASTPAGDPARKMAVAALRASIPKAREAGERIDPLTEEAREAEEQLAQDDEARARRAEVISVGSRAETKLRMRLRSRISDAVGGGQLLPVWFATAFGPMAPARGAEAWLDTATDVLVYRSTYRVTDPVVALGTRPDVRQSRRAAWHKELSDKLRRWS
ncbi:CopG family transcriptional regulator [Streptomyces sp. DSM 42041]|uniref:CopG family transcriptional regulator n=1 Tax=Streptomyces hazeniae TaxID=3075538 RepID=A0ABU2P3N6_9ACTN|nr:CopG family transcriptional regulator [Streptomyces sp. DSM 42041]MDT0382518.1 CopG family transcriptional regulator [Streptomyces sp. DSM 42041]